MLYLGPSRRLCSDINCFSPQKHLNCFETPRIWGHPSRRLGTPPSQTNGTRITPAFTLRQVGCRVTRVPGAQFTALEADTWWSLWSDSGSWQRCWGSYIWKKCTTHPRLCAGAGILLELLHGRTQAIQTGLATRPQLDSHDSWNGAQVWKGHRLKDGHPAPAVS